MTTISGATINGSPAAANTLKGLIGATPANGTLALPAGFYSGTSTIDRPMTITGAGMGLTVIDGTGLMPAMGGKALLVPTVPGVTITDLTIQNSAIPGNAGGNASAVRDAADGIGFALNCVEINHCQDGILTFASAITLSSCNFHDNGNGDPGGGETHEMYIGGDTNNVVTLNQTSASCGLLAAHAVKSRAGTSNIFGGTFLGNHDDGTVGGSVLDFPDEGMVWIINATIKTGANAGNIQFLHYGEEGKQNASIGKTVNLIGVTFVDQTGSGGLIESADPTANLVISQSTYKGTIPPETRGWASVTGKLTPAP